MPSALIRYASLLQVLVNGLQATITQSPFQPAEGGRGFNLGVKFPWYINDRTRICFGSPVALRLAQTWQLPAMEVAEQLVGYLPLRLACLPAEPILLDFTLAIKPPGWIHCHPSDQCLAAWLQQIVQMPPQLILPELSTAPQILPWHNPSIEPFQGVEDEDPPQFALQYAHARCCALVRLAHRQGLLHLIEPNTETSPAVWQCQPIPWLNPQGQPQLVHPAERTLMAQLLAFPTPLSLHQPTGNIESMSALVLPVAWPLPNHQLWLQANALSDAFQLFYRNCRIWGEVKDPGLAQARLGLVLITQSVLRFVLQDLLGVFAPLEL